VTGIHIVLGSVATVTLAVAGVWGAWLWWRVEAQPAFWTVLRAGEAFLAVQVLWGGVLLALGEEPPSLHILYGVLPLAVTFVGEQLRLVAAEQVLERRGLENARAMEGLPEPEQRLIVLEIVRRETGVMAAAALVAVLLALRAAGVTGFV
jgi:hypothetical protein